MNLSKFKETFSIIASMKKFFVTGIVCVIFVVYAVFYHKSSSNTSLTAGKIIPATNSHTTNSSQSPSSIQTVGAFKDGVYTGAIADAFYGTIQVQAVIKNGKIADVQFLQYPHDQEESVQVNQSAMPLLKQEAIQKQNAQVDIISGATQTSQAFQQSLASALTQAK